MKFWHPNFNPLTEKFYTLPTLVGLPNLPVFLWNNDALMCIGNHLGKFLYFPHSKESHECAKMYVEMPVSNGYPEELMIELDGCKWLQPLEYGDGEKVRKEESFNDHERSKDELPNRMLLKDVPVKINTKRKIM
jgi:hypothetical protein